MLYQIVWLKATATGTIIRKLLRRWIWTQMNNQRKFEPYAELSNEAYENFNAKLLDGQDAYGQIENDEKVTVSFNKDVTKTEDSQNSSTNLYSTSLIPERLPWNCRDYRKSHWETVNGF